MNLEMIEIQILVTTLVALFFLSLLKIKQNYFVKKNSKKLNNILKINLNYEQKFYSVKPQIIINESFKSKSTFDNLDGEKVLKKIIEVFIENIDSFQSNISSAKSNDLIWTEYNQEVLKLINSPSNLIKNSHIKAELKIIRKKLLVKPLTSVTLKYFGKYSSPKGRSIYEHTWEYSYDDVLETLEDALNEIEYRKSKEHFKKIQRSKINDSIRFDIFKRDGYQCKICGSSPNDDGEITLHVDHIIPVAKGGTSDYENLQTLCSRCNMGKKAKYM